MPASVSDNPSLITVHDESDPSEIGMPLFLSSVVEKSDTMDQKSGQRDEDPVPASSNLSGFTMSTGELDDTRAVELLPGFPGHGVEKSTDRVSQSIYPAVDISVELRNAHLEGRKSINSKDVGQTTAITGSSAVYEAGTLTSVPIFPAKSRAHYSAVEIPAELEMDGRKSASMEECDRATTTSSRFQESSNSSSVSLPDHRNFPVSGNAAAFRADLWHRTSPAAAYMNDRLLLAGAANLRHFDAGFSPRSPESVPTSLIHRYSQSHPTMPGNFLGGVVDFRRLPPENPSVTSHQTDLVIPDASPLSLARYQHK